MMPNHRILILSNRLDALSRLGKILWESNFDLSLTTDGEVFWQRMKIIPVNLVILCMDIADHELKRYCNQFERSYGKQRIPLLLILDSDPEASPWVGLEHGVADCVREPISPMELISKVTSCLREREQIHFLMERNYHLEQSNKEKDRNFSIVSHDLKAPFQGMLGLLDVFYKEHTQLTQSELASYIGGLRETMANTYSVLENLLDYSGIHVGSVIWTPERLNLKEIVEDIIELFSPGAQEKKLSLTSNVANEFEIVADRRMLTSIIRNLVYNSIKFSNQGGKVSVDSSRLNGFYVVSVEDEGVGISEQKLTQLLYKKNRGITTMGTSRESGSGLGLQLCNHFTDLHGGDLTIQSSQGSGCKVTISIPVKEVVE